MPRLPSIFSALLIGLLGGLFALWASAALFFDCRIPFLGLPLAIAHIVLAAVLLWRRKWLAVVAIETAILAWWLSLTPTNVADWQPDVARIPDASVDGNTVTFHNVRNCHYQTELRYDCEWKTRQYSLASLRHVDLFLTHWGAPLIAHVIVSFDFGDGRYLAFSIEARKRGGQEYSAIRGFFRQYGLIYLVSYEQDVIRLRTNYRQGEYVSLYRTRTTPADARGLLLAYVKWIHEIRQHPRWYNALTENCDRSLVRYLAAERVGGVSRWDLRGFLNGNGDKMLYDLGDLVDEGLPFDELKGQAVINGIAQHLPDDASFSEGIRRGRVGFKANE